MYFTPIRAQSKASAHQLHERPLRRPMHPYSVAGLMSTNEAMCHVYRQIHDIILFLIISCANNILHAKIRLELFHKTIKRSMCTKSAGLHLDRAHLDARRHLGASRIVTKSKVYLTVFVTKRKYLNYNIVTKSEPAYSFRLAFSISATARRASAGVMRNSLPSGFASNMRHPLSLARL